MSTMTVFLPAITDVTEFVNIMGRFPFEAQLTVGSYAVDAKSLMGIFTLDRAQPLRLVAETTDSDALTDLTQAIGRFLQPISQEA